MHEREGKIYGVQGTHLTSSCFTRKLSFPAMYSPAQEPGMVMHMPEAWWIPS